MKGHIAAFIGQAGEIPVSSTKCRAHYAFFRIDRLYQGESILSLNKTCGAMEKRSTHHPFKVAFTGSNPVCVTIYLKFQKRKSNFLYPLCGRLVLAS